MITRNSAKCVTCSAEIVSTHRHAFIVHYCKLNPKPELEWKDGVLVVKDPPEITWNFAVDGGTAYLRRCGEGYIDTSVENEE